MVRLLCVRVRVCVCVCVCVCVADYRIFSQPRLKLLYLSAKTHSQADGRLTQGCSIPNFFFKWESENEHPKRSVFFILWNNKVMIKAMISI